MEVESWNDPKLGYRIVVKKGTLILMDISGEDAIEYAYIHKINKQQEIEKYKDMAWRDGYVQALKNIKKIHPDLPELQGRFDEALNEKNS